MGLGIFKWSFSRSKQRMLCYSLVQLSKNRSIGSIFRVGKWSRRDLENPSSVPCDSGATRVSEDNIFHQDSAALHLSVLVRQYLNQKYPTDLMGRAWSFNGLRPHWIFRPMTSLLWRYLNDIVYREPPNAISNLRASCTQEVAIIDQDSSKKVYKKMEIRVCLLLREGQGHFNYFLNWKTYFHRISYVSLSTGKD